MKTNDKDDQKYALEDFKLNPLSSLDAMRPNTTIDDDDGDILSLNAAPQVPVEAKIVSEELELRVEETAAETSAEEDSTTETENPILEESEETETAAAAAIEDPIFKELSEPKLPELKRENRARLQMQSPTKIHFYWSVAANPFQTLSRAFGSQTNYQLVAKLVNRTTDREEIFPVEREGSAWFDADANQAYQAELGFYAVNRPFVRLMFSNRIETPRRNPSARRDYSEKFTVSAQEFAEVLDVSGFQQDAFEVALAGDDEDAATRATNQAFAQIVETTPADYFAGESSEMRFVLLALASGYQVETLRGHISRSLFNQLEKHGATLSADKALAALQTNFGVFAGETIDEEKESFGATVFGASLVNFPRLSKRRTLPKFSPVSSLRAKFF